MDILEFQGENRWLSNFWPAPVFLDGILYPTVENAYQAAKTNLAGQRTQFQYCTAGQAKRLGRTVTIRPDWDAVKVPIMQTLLMQKFHSGTELGDKLLATGDANIVEGNSWGDTFWGVCRGVGQNHLGRLLMGQRNVLRTVTGNQPKAKQ